MYRWLHIEQENIGKNVLQKLHDILWNDLCSLLDDATANKQPQMRESSSQFIDSSCSVPMRQISGTLVPDPVGQTT